MTNRNHRARAAFTLIEVLVATAVTLLMMISLAQIFKIIGDSMQEGRATLELNNRLRNVALRIQHDLRNLVLDEHAGYVEYTDGAQTDATSGLARPGNIRPVGASRYGDLDDVLMFTAKAEDVWFSGKVPRFILTGTDNFQLPSMIGGPPAAAPFTNSLADFEMVTIASEYAEIAVFAQPVVSNAAGNTSFDPAPLVLDTTAFLDANGDSFPDDYNLHYSVKLIRPDLNTAGLGSVGEYGAAGRRLPIAYHPEAGEPWMVAQPGTAFLRGATTGTALPSPLCDMARVHSQCDLSLRRIVLPAGTDHILATRDFVAANDLQSLRDPANRFAHVRIPIITGSGVSGLTMPLLALAARVGVGPTPYFDFDGDGSDDMAEPTGVVTTGTGTNFVGTGFLHPAFTMHTAWDDGLAGSGLPEHGISAGRVGDDILATNIRAFDVKCYDPGVPVMASLGGAPLQSPSENLAGVSGLDDDGNGAIDDATEIGWEGTDDEMLLPSDPGYLNAWYRWANRPGPLSEAEPFAFGGYVDLGWARKIAVTSPAFGISVSSTDFPSQPNFWSAFSGYDARGWTSTGPYITDELYRSGKVVAVAGSAIPTIMQFTADTADYDHIESNGTLEAQVQVSGTNRFGVVQITTSPFVLLPQVTTGLYDSWRLGIADLSTDGLDNDANGFSDDEVERESSSPFNQKLTGIKVSIRMEDPATRIVKQQSVTQHIPEH